MIAKKRLRPGSMKGVPPCPRCGAVYPVIQCWWEDGVKIVVCTHCAIQAKLITLPKAEAEAYIAAQKAKEKASA